TYQGSADTDADGLGDADVGPIAAQICTPLSFRQGRYDITVNATAATFAFTATPAGVMAGDGILTLDDAGNRGWDQNGDGDTTDAGEQTWEY
ncbi:MAG: general secretion pathway protein GspH, partial [Gammaproteobacteria bacterium]|nr:general secretion pathway protein GspH [Gammaproteobacteria bacterium]